MRLDCKIIILAAFLFINCHSSAYARHIDGPDPWGRSFSLNLGRDVIGFDFDGIEIESRLDHLSVQFTERFSQFFEVGVELGYLDLDQTDRPSTAGLNLNGGLLGIFFNSELPVVNNIGADLGVAYRYNLVNSESAPSDVEIEWQEIIARVGLSFDLGRSSFSTGALLQALDGDESVSGENRKTSNFGEAESVGAYFQFNVWTDASGKVAIEFQSGSRDVLRLKFRRDY